MGENKMCLSIGGNLFWFGVAILITRFCLFVPGWAKTECDPLYIIAVIGFLLYCVAWYSLVYRDRDDEYYAYTNSSIVTQYAAGAAAILRWICVSCLFAFMLKMVWNSGVLGVCRIVAARVYMVPVRELRRTRRDTQRIGGLRIFLHAVRVYDL